MGFLEPCARRSVRDSSVTPPVCRADNATRTTRCFVFFSTDIQCWVRCFTVHLVGAIDNSCVAIWGLLTGSNDGDLGKSEVLSFEVYLSIIGYDSNAFLWCRTIRNRFRVNSTTLKRKYKTNICIRYPLFSKRFTHFMWLCIVFDFVHT